MWGIQAAAEGCVLYPKLELEVRASYKAQEKARADRDPNQSR